MTPDSPGSFENPSWPKIETVRSPRQNEASFSPERGGIITSLKLGGTEVFYMDRETLGDEEASVRGGIPIMFPNAGIIDNPNYPGLKRHGFAKTSSKWVIEQQDENGFSETLTTDEETRRVYPYDAQLRIRGEFHDDDSFTLHQEVANLDSAREMPVSMGLHPYFRVPSDEKKNIKFNFAGGEEIENDFETWSNGGTTFVDNPKVGDPAAVLRATIPSLGTIIIDASPEYKRIWVWSQPGKDFVCIEPVMRDPGGLTDDPEMVEPGKTRSASVNFRLEN